MKWDGQTKTNKKHRDIATTRPNWYWGPFSEKGRFVVTETKLNFISIYRKISKEHVNVLSSFPKC